MPPTAVTATVAAVATEPMTIERSGRAALPTAFTTEAGFAAEFTVSVDSVCLLSADLPSSAEAAAEAPASSAPKPASRRKRSGISPITDKRSHAFKAIPPFPEFHGVLCAFALKSL